ncbi:MAG TPA: DUF2007 domain-containing protein [Solirubrobacteraceae bacterium]|nr:DUF2007 domain-containing protein [Solirubrobacteraceae bacterium]
MSDKVVTSVGSMAEAEIIQALLLKEGIDSLTQRTTGGSELGDSGGRSVLVREEDLERARAVLEAEVSEDELIRESERPAAE